MWNATARSSANASAMSTTQFPRQGERTSPLPIHNEEIFMLSIQQLTEKRVAAYNAASEILKKENRTADETAKFDTLMSEVNSIAQDIERVRKAEEVEKELRTINFKPESQTGNTGKETNQ